LSLRGVQQQAAKPFPATFLHHEQRRDERFQFRTLVKFALDSMHAPDRAVCIQKYEREGIGPFFEMLAQRRRDPIDGLF
jgi:hypothetical protein